jgi:hypothetical protein
MQIARSLERRLEKLLEEAPGRFFSGRLHPSELAGRIAREADLAVYSHETGPATANRYVLTVSPGDVTTNVTNLGASLENALEDYAAEAGLRLEGAPDVEIVSSNAVAPGQFTCEAAVRPGPLPPWARLGSASGSFGIGHNRALIGRSAEADVVIERDEISRRHALLWRERGNLWLRDLHSSNRTSVDGSRAHSEPLQLHDGSTVAIGGHRFRLTVN